MAFPEDLTFLAGQNDTFEMDVEDYRSDYHQLMQERGFSEDSLEAWVGQPITEESIKSCLKYFYDDAPIGLLIYFYEEEQLKVWLLNQEGFQYQTQFNTTIEEIDQLEKGLGAALELNKFEQNRAVRKRGAGREDIGLVDPQVQLDSVVDQLSALLLPAGLTDHLRKSATEHLIIVPALNLQQIPFSILKPFADDTLFVEKWSYSIASSIYDIARLTLRKQSRKSGVVGFEENSLNAENTVLVGNPKFSKSAGWTLSPLPGSEKEIHAISEQLSIDASEVLVGEAAILPAVKQKTQDALLLYFATHGIADPDEPLDGSGLFFAPTEENKTGFWTAREIQNDNFSAILVVLSACQTGLGKSRDAGVIGLSRAFHLAGAENILMSLWSVDDNATNSLMQLFMQKIHEPHKFFPSEPLRQAMLEYRKLYPQDKPIFWASFSTFGIPY